MDALALPDLAPADFPELTSADLELWQRMLEAGTVTPRGFSRAEAQAWLARDLDRLRGGFDGFSG